MSNDANILAALKVKKGEAGAILGALVREQNVSLKCESSILYASPQVEAFFHPNTCIVVAAAFNGIRRLTTFLDTCFYILGRSYLDDQNAKIAEEKKAAKCMVVKGNQCYDAVRIESEYLDSSDSGSSIFTNAYHHKYMVIHDGGDVKVNEKWFVYGAEQKDEVNKYISSKMNVFINLVLEEMYLLTSSFRSTP
ncbi:hypothetical protein TSUD_286220 [Trifolium subterraneum]|uniref:Uncharacterized protein n=1 Tax=Trifolium subterraneum TaxID=3900 RepID=A0A2Z6PBD3_TRISU|nr:hypothetical protein TSUD_286220 [Trifolium subterraneum]